MIAYADSSVLLRKVLREPDPLSEWPEVRTLIVSELVVVECARAFDRLRLVHALDDEELGYRQEAITKLLVAADVMQVDRQTLLRAAQAFATPIGTLDAIHLATALLYREATDSELVFATHDVQLATAARAHSLPVIGVAAKSRR